MMKMIMGAVEQRNLQGVTMNLTHLSSTELALAKLDNQRRPDYRQQSIETEACSSQTR